ncbi:hypothetical protein [Sphingomonas sp.]|uniref:hypothetical protein n=1 Tax=Sphingomonas sp. TaxID=28214 RepID=UPI0025809347|nr:hypothetical protein [Sphingomonas sp.]
MSDTNQLSRAQQLLEEFKAGLDKDGPVVLAQRVAALEAELAGAKDAADSNHESLTGQLVAADDRIAALTEERDAALERATKAEAAGQKAVAQVKKLTTPAKPRKLGPLSSDLLDATALLEAIADADEIQIAFSDGKKDVAGIAPIAVSGDAWKRHQFGVMLAAPIELEGPQGGASTRIAGYALLLDGKQVAWCERSSPLPIAPGQRVTIVDDVLF